MVTCLCNLSISCSFKQCFFICASSTMQHSVSSVLCEQTFQWNILHLHFSCLCEKLYSGAHFHFLPLFLLKLVCVNVNNVCKHWQCNNIITNSSFFNSFNVIFFYLISFFVFFFIDFVAFFYMFLEKSMFVSTLVILFLGVFFFSSFLMHPCCKSELLLHSLQKILHPFFPMNFVPF